MPDVRTPLSKVGWEGDGVVVRRRRLLDHEAGAVPEASLFPSIVEHIEALHELHRRRLQDRLGHKKVAIELGHIEGARGHIAARPSEHAATLRPDRRELALDHAREAGHRRCRRDQLIVDEGHVGVPRTHSGWEGEPKKVEALPLATSTLVVREEHEPCEHVVGRRVLGHAPRCEMHRRLRAARRAQDGERRPRLIAVLQDGVVERWRVKVGQAALHADEVADGHVGSLLSKERGHARPILGCEQLVHVHGDRIIE